MNKVTRSMCCVKLLLLNACVSVHIQLMSYSVFYLVALSILAKCLMSEKKTDEAVTLLRESMDIEKSPYPDNQASIAISELLSYLTVTRGLSNVPELCHRSGCHNTSYRFKHGKPYLNCIQKCNNIIRG